MVHAIRIDQTTPKDGQVDTAEAEWDGRVFRAASSHGASMALARQLVAAGCPDQPWHVPGRLHGRSLHRLARLTIEEGADGLRFRRYRETPRVADQTARRPWPYSRTPDTRRGVGGMPPG